MFRHRRAPEHRQQRHTGAGSAPTLGVANQGDLSLSGVSILRKGTQLIISATITNSGIDGGRAAADRQPGQPDPDPQPADPGAGPRERQHWVDPGTSAVLDQQGRLEPGGTVDLMLDFRDAGQFQVFSGFQIPQ